MADTIADALGDVDGGSPSSSSDRDTSGDDTAEVGAEDKLMQLVKADTGPGQPDDETYIDHPLNFNGSAWMGRFIRGLTGMFGELRYAVIDLMIAPLEGAWTMYQDYSGGDGGES